MLKQLTLIALLAVAAVKADYDPNNLPDKTDAAHGQYGTNNCKKYGASSQKSRCQNVFINSVKDFCLWAPPKPNSQVGATEELEVAWCMKPGYGTRLIPDGTIKGAHFLKTPSFVQVTGRGDLTKINIQARDAGGELDPHGATGAGNPVGGLVFTNAFTGQYQQIHEWQNFMSSSEYCIRACIGPYAKQWCPHIYDVMGCYWNEPANYSKGVFEQCDGQEGAWPGVYNGSTFYQGQKKTPGPQAAGKSSNCQSYASISNGAGVKRSMQTVVARAPEWHSDE